MSRERKSVPLYRRLNANGTPTIKLSGVSATLKPGDDATTDSVTWLVAEQTLGDVRPLIGDRLCDTAARWWVATNVGAIEGGVYPIKCERLKEGDA